mmetsp:Transcript_753/g.1586  ORF Transcript_753/g.1586 Transcript_753/m.1586 type:complete len:414 (-) Transcript_753:107-1348(-)
MTIEQAKEAFKGGAWADSIAAVTKLLQDGDVYSMFEIRAEAYLKEQNLQAALKDAQAMTAVDPSKSKGYLLQTQALRALQKYVPEIETYQDGLKNVDREDEGYGSLKEGLHDAQQLSKSILNDPKMMELFVLFDKDQKSSVDFKDVAIGLYKLTNNMQDAQRQAAALLLMMDEDDERTLVYEKFAKLIMAMTAISGITFGTLYHQLQEALQEDTPLPEEFLTEIRLTQKELNVARDNMKEQAEAKKTLSALSYGRTSKLFELWDDDKNGTINFQELLAGLRKYQRAVTKNAFNSSNPNITTNACVMNDVEKNALMVMGKDKDNNQELDKEEFAHAISDYADLIDVDLHELIDFMCAVASQPDTRDIVTEYEAMYSDVTPSAYKSWSLKKHQAMGGLGTIVDMLEEDEEEEEEE